MKTFRFFRKVGVEIFEQQVSFIAAVVSLGMIAYDKFVEPVTIPTGSLSLTTAGAPQVGLSLFTAGVIILAIVVTYGVVKTVNK